MTQEDQVTREPMRAKLAAPAANADLVLRDTQNWSSRSHRELYEAVHQGNEPGRVGELAQDWARMGTEIGESSQRMAERLRGTEEGWQGEAAHNARGAIHELARWTSDAGETAGHLGQRIGEQGQVMEVAKTSMPEPKDVEFRDEIIGIYGLAGRGSEASVLAGFLAATQDMKKQQDKADSAHDQAVAVMEQMESDSRVVDGRTPRFEPPPDPIRDGEKMGVKSAATPLQPNEAHANRTPNGTESAGVTEPGETPGAPQPGGPVPPGDSQQGGAEATKRMPVLNTPASSAPASAPHLESTPQISGDKGGPGQGPGARVPSLDGFGGGGNNRGGRPLGKTGPDSTTSQGTGPGRTSPNGLDQPTIKHRPVPKLDSPETPGGGPVVPGGRGPGGRGPGGGYGPGGNGPGGNGPGGNGPGGNGPGGRSGWSGAIPPIPGTSGPGAGGLPGSGGSGGSGGPLGAGGAGGPQGSGGSGGSNVGAGGRSSVGMGPGGGPAGGPTGGGSSGSSGAGAGGMGAPGAAAGRGRGGEDEERKAKYVESTPIVEVPGADLPPPVIGGGKPKKKDS